MNESLGMENPYEGQPHGWIQWKGTDVCVDIRCECGGTSHFDGTYMYAIRCPYCHKAYIANGHIALHPITEVEAKAIGYEIMVAKGGEA